MSDHIVRVQSGESGPCEVEGCSNGIDGINNFAESVNHYIAHGYELIHVGQESTSGEDVWQNTVAILKLDEEGPIPTIRVDR